MKKKDRYLKIVEWSDEDQCYVGSIPGWIGKCCHGANEEEVYHQLCQILEEWIEIYEEDKIPLPSNITAKKYSGKFQLRIDRDLHKVLAVRAMQANESLNSFCGKILRKTILQSDASRSDNCVEND
ncbi:MAG: toxin-antitoxin system HicB family antitoxin [Desulfobacteraceae bacterium]|jgi:predicted HicB family RNase H-like nuclease|nr:toxin-antitoxin system HicB family antitoxin [Desulfobacteraceae bacterium]